MKTKVRIAGIVVMLIAVVSLGMGIAFVQQGFAKQAFLSDAMSA
jgi:hypothetical protein